ncbi:ATP-dependent DNA ligase [Paenibacillus harenae]|uniref:ATP-dependent DNA ligase n=1 Tax=Paenibacillus harenae TaxID=306543 RepID=UPI0027904E41|nr:DNA ligase [Paenibacillus harenae]MDQ0057908.1 bifunctional non-homologous end joining protein LigD [Paenibacillus harenae]
MDLKPVYPFEPISTTTPPTGDNWVSQIKWDGVRVLLYNDGNATKLINRRLNERTLQYPELLDARLFCKADSVILDGEIIAFDQSKPSFYEVMKRDSLKQSQKIKQTSVQIPVTYMIFDVLFYNGDWVTDRSLQDRQALLDQIIIPQNNVQIVQNFVDGEALFELMKQNHMEGIVYKDLGSTYRIDGKDGRWRKLKVMKDLYAVVGGVTLNHSIVNSLMLGIYTNDRELIYIGHAGTGKLSQRDWAKMTEEIKGIQTDQSPFHNEPERTKDAIWVKPELTVKVEYFEFTSKGTMRHPSIQAVVKRDVNECTIDQLKGQ